VAAPPDDNDVPLELTDPRRTRHRSYLRLHWLVPQPARIQCQHTTFCNVR
jgi:hypothetical protein